jgi:hypothetical protein
VGAVAVVSWQTQGQCDAFLNQEECDDESAVNMSRLFALRHDLLKEQENVRILKEDICEAKTVLQNLENQLNNTLEGMEKQEMDIRALLTAEHDVHRSQFCDDNTPRDCCQVRCSYDTTVKPQKKTLKIRDTGGVPHTNTLVYLTTSKLRTPLNKGHF